MKIGRSTVAASFSDAHSDISEPSETEPESDISDILFRSAERLIQSAVNLVCPPHEIS